jgi:hypothetical protein
VHGLSSAAGEPRCQRGFPTHSDCTVARGEFGHLLFINLFEGAGPFGMPQMLRIPNDLLNRGGGNFATVRCSGTVLGQSDWSWLTSALES